MPDFSYAPSRPVGRPTGPQIARPTVAIADRPQRFRWPSQKAETPSHCTGCGTRLLAGDIPTADHPLTDATCWQCGRVACELIADGWQRPMTAAEYAALPKQAPRSVNHPEGPAVARLVRRLDHGWPMTAHELSEALGISDAHVRNTICEARRSGHEISWVEGAYVLEQGR